MGLTLTEKILNAHTDRPVRPGEFAIVRVDLAYVQDGTGPLAVRQLKAMGFTKLANPRACIAFLDHASPSPRQELSNDHAFLRTFTSEYGARLSDVGNGISHTVVNETDVAPGMVIVGADSHTCTNGAMCAFATGMGSTDVAVAMALGHTWMRVPEAWRVVFNGSLPKAVSGKDVMLFFIGRIRDDGANYKALEFAGPVIETMSMAGRLTMSNMAVECGAKVGLIASDDVTRARLEYVGRPEAWRELKPDPDADYERVLEYDVSDLSPQIAKPHRVHNVVPVEEVEGLNVNQVFIGSSTNARIDDYRVAASILRGKRVADGLRLLVTPGSRSVYMKGLEDGTFLDLIAAGAVVTTPGCGACVGVHEGIPGDGEVVVSTMNRNFRGRMGNPNAFIYLASPETAAATAIEGKIADPRKYVD
jgi:3-isopropylmalate/(R)-2-methylmalate dehydratase large subunit